MRDKNLLVMLVAFSLLTGCAWFLEGMGLAPLGQGPRADARQLEYVKSHPDLDYDMRTAIMGGSILEGMTKDEVRASWGSPCLLCYGNGEDYYRGVRVETVVYGVRGRPTGHTYIYFENGEVVGWSAR